MRLLTRLVGAVQWDFVLLALLALAANAAFLFDPSFIPTHDTYLNTIAFHAYYSELSVHSEVLLWLPCVNHGVPFSFWNNTIFTPSDYGMMAVGYLLNIKDVVALQKWGIFCDHLIFLLGMFLLSQKLFVRRVAVFVVCLAAIAAPVWFSQVNHTFRTMYLFPFALLFIYQFATSRQARYLWIAGLFVLLALPGNPAYSLAVQALALTACLLVLLIRDPGLLRSFVRPSLADLAWLLVLLGSALAFWQVLQLSLRGVEIATEGRRVDGSIELSYWLRGEDAFSRTAPPVMYLYGWPLSLEVNLYLGLLPWAMLLWAVVRVRSVKFYAILLPLVVLFATCYVDAFAIALYHGFPLIKYFKPIRYVLGWANLFVLLAAGFGLDNFLNAGWRKQLAFLAIVLVGAGALGFALRERPWSSDAFSGTWTRRVEFLSLSGLLFFVIRLAVYALGLASVALVRSATAANREARGSRALAVVLVLCFAFDIGSHRLLASRCAPTATSHQRELFQVRALNYVPERSADYTLRAPPPSPGTIYDLQYELEEIDPCLEETRSLLLPSGRRALLEARRITAPGNALWKKDAENGMLRVHVTLPTEDPALARAMGCGRPKLQVFGEVRWAATPAEARQLLADIRDIDQLPVLIASPPDSPAKNQPVPAPAPQSEVAVTAFTPNELVVNVEVASDRPVWLYYADANHEDWTATVNGKPAPIYPANLVYKAVRLDPGHNQVCWRFGGFSRRLLAYGQLTLGTGGFLLAMAAVAACCLGKLSSGSDLQGGEEEARPLGPGSAPAGELRPLREETVRNNLASDSEAGPGAG